MSQKKYDLDKSGISTWEYANALLNTMKLLNSSSDNLVYIYDKYCLKLDAVNKALAKGEYFTALSELYDYKQMCDVPSEKKIWSRYQKETESKLNKKVSYRNLKAVIKDLDEYRFHNQNEKIEFNTDRLYFIFENVLMLVRKKAFEQSGSEITVEEKKTLYHIGISAAAHTGHTTQARNYYEKYKRLAEIDTDKSRSILRREVLSDDVFDAIIRRIGIDHDSFRFEEAEKDACYFLGVPKNKSLRRFSEKLLGNKVKSRIRKDDLKRLPIRKLASILGQTYAFLNNPLAETYFEEVLMYMYCEGQQKQAPDYYITLSYLLQWYIENNEQKKYEKRAYEFFGGSDSLSEQLEYLLKRGKEDQEENNNSCFPDYALYIFIKAFYAFYKEDIDNKDVLIKLTHIDKTVEGYVKYLTGHPWEIIFKYAALLEEYDRSVKAGTNIEKANKAAGHEEIIELVILYGELEYRESRIDHGHVNEKSRESFEKNHILPLWNRIKNNPEIPDKWTKEDSDTDKRERLREMFSYMFH